MLGLYRCIRGVAFVVYFWAEVDCGDLEIRKIGFGYGGEGTWLDAIVIICVLRRIMSTSDFFFLFMSKSLKL